MDHIKHEKADAAAFYTYKDYLKDKKSGVKKDSFAYTYWEYTDSYINNLGLTSNRADLDDFYSQNLCRSINSTFSSLRDYQESGVQKYLMDHDLEIDQWPDPYLPILWCPEDKYNPQFPEWKRPYFKNSDTGFSFNYFGEEYQFGASYQFEQDPGTKVHWLSGSGILNSDKKIRKNLLNQSPIAKLKQYQNQFLSIPEYKNLLNAERQLRKVQKEMEPDKRNTERTSIWNRIVWFLIMAVGALCISLILLCAYWYFSGQPYDTLAQQISSSHDENSPFAILSVWLTLGYVLYSVPALGSLLGGTPGFLIGEGILLLLSAVLIFILADRLKAKEAPFGKEARESKKKAAYWKKQLEEAEKELKKAQAEYEEAKAAIMASAGYKEAVYQQTWWVNNCIKLAPQWHEAWYACCNKRSHFTKMSDPAIKKAYEKRIIPRPL